MVTATAGVGVSFAMTTTPLARTVRVGARPDGLTGGGGDLGSVTSRVRNTRRHASAGGSNHADRARFDGLSASGHAASATCFDGSRACDRALVDRTRTAIERRRNRLESTRAGARCSLTLSLSNTSRAFSCAFALASSAAVMPSLPDPIELLEQRRASTSASGVPSVAVADTV